MMNVFKNQIMGYINLIRPFTLLAPIIISLCIMIASLFYYGKADIISFILLTKIIPACLSLAILNGASNALNQVTDIKADRISKPYRPIVQGSISINEAILISIILYILAISISLLVNTLFIIFILLIAIFTVTYSLPPRFKDLLYVNQLWVGVPRGLLGILASWSVFGNALEPLPLAIGIIAMCFLIGGSITKDINDSLADKKAGTHTLVNTYGVKKAALMSLPFLILPFAYIPILIDSGILDSYLLFLTFFAIPGFLIFHLMIKDDKKIGFLENTSSWTLMYITYFAFAFSFSFLTIIGSISG
ncbi:4-hydroxybenzoate polyprenyltransferase [Thermoplasmatales archaeon SG8-52-4]|nr:MAG: 4-hydroxybenzoate polyprenyltransferase [Thermoplasmatales archaeon SG8-52-4]